MNKVLLGVVVLAVGALVGWYYFGGNAAGIPGMQVVSPRVSPMPTSGVVDESGMMKEPAVEGSGKGGVVVAQDTVVYTDNGYQPKSLTIKKGTRVTFRNDSASSMWTASGTHPTHQLLPGFDQKQSVGKGGTYEYTFTSVGTWQYHNHVNPSDVGYIVVTQ